MKTTFFTIFTMLIVFLRVFYVIYVKMSFHVIVPLRDFGGGKQPQEMLRLCVPILEKS